MNLSNVNVSEENPFQTNDEIELRRRAIESLRRIANNCGNHDKQTAGCFQIFLATFSSIITYAVISF